MDRLDINVFNGFVPSHTVDCRTKEDQYIPHIHDIMIMDVNGSDTIIVADFNNNCIKSFYEKNNQPHYSRLIMPRKPGQITKLEDNKIAVTLFDYFSPKIAVVSVTPDLDHDKPITTQKMYNGLTALTPTKLAAGSFYPPCVDILHFVDRSWKVIKPKHNKQKIVQAPYFLCNCTTRKGNILISDDGTNSVVCVTSEREVVFNYSPTGDRALKYPRGITSTAAGDILVVDCDGDKVIQLSESGEFVRDILTSQEKIHRPWGIAWDERGIIYVTHWSRDKGATVQVYTLN